MRNLLFRMLMGLTALMLAWVLAFAHLPRLNAYGVGLIATGFGLYAVLGLELGDRVLLMVLTARDPHRLRKGAEDEELVSTWPPRSCSGRSQCGKNTV